MRHRLVWLAIVFAAWLAPPPSRATEAWVKGDVLLNVRAGPGAQFRPLGVVTTGDPVQIVEHGDGWTHVRTEKAGEGWIPSGFLQDRPPAVVLLQQAQSEASELRERVEALAAEAERLRAESERSAARESEQSREIERLAREKADLVLEARWPEWIAGASLLFTGGLLGAWVRGSARRLPRVRL
jgi:uncharacterized protein YgiM (DUF1202 family)